MLGDHDAEQNDHQYEQSGRPGRRNGLRLEGCIASIVLAVVVSITLT
jgi:hypothetical protein